MLVFLHLSSVSPGIDLDQARKAEEQQMLQDARQWLNRRRIEDKKQPRTGATALHVAAAKGYSEVMRYFFLVSNAKLGPLDTPLLLLWKESCSAPEMCEAANSFSLNPNVNLYTFSSYRLNEIGCVYNSEGDVPIADFFCGGWWWSLGKALIIWRRHTTQWNFSLSTLPSPNNTRGPVLLR